MMALTGREIAHSEKSWIALVKDPKEDDARAHARRTLSIPG